jgi:hypothetical protein
MSGNSVLKKLEDISSKLSQMLSEAESQQQQQQQQQYQQHATEPKSKSGLFSFLSQGGKSLPQKTNRKHKCTDGVERVVYKQGNDHFVKRKSSNGKMKFYRVKL